MQSKKLVYLDDVRRAVLQTNPSAAFCLNRLKPVDAVEVIHAHWEDGCAIHNGKEVYKSIDCSHCEGVFKIESETREYWKGRFKVCPFCGAIMDGGNEDGNL